MLKHFSMAHIIHYLPPPPQGGRTERGRIGGQAASSISRNPAWNRNVASVGSIQFQSSIGYWQHWNWQHFHIGNILPGSARRLAPPCVRDGARPSQRILSWRGQSPSSHCSQMAIDTNVHKSQMAEICIGGNCEQLRFVDNTKFVPLTRAGKGWYTNGD